MFRQAVIATVLTAAVSVSSGAAVVIYTGGIDGGTNGWETAVAGATTIDFDAALPGNPTYTDLGAAGKGVIVNGSVSGAYATPAGDTTDYLTVANGLSVGSQVIEFSFGIDYFGFYWGSIDDYNTVAFYDAGDNLIASFDGTDVPGADAVGNQSSSADNQYVNFSGLGGARKVIISTSEFAFETDNHAFMSVPAPAALGLIGFGLACLGMGSKRRSRAA